MMNLLEKYCEYAKAGDSGKFSDLFAEDAIFHDEAPTQIGMDPIHLEGRAAIKETFDMIFSQGGTDIANIAIYGNAMRYDVISGDVTFPCLGVMQEENGLIKQYNVVIPK
jgi:hypothetical protein